jgi:hypothetical protein
MVLEALSAFSLASNVVQFIEFACKLVSESKDAYHSAVGMSSEYVELELITTDLSQLTEGLISETSNMMRPHQTSDELELSKVAMACRTLTEELIDSIQNMKVEDGPHRKWKTFRQALSCVWKKQKG